MWKPAARALELSIHLCRTSIDSEQRITLCLRDAPRVHLGSKQASTLRRRWRRRSDTV